MHHTTKACYKKVPVRHETILESRFRHYDQVPMGHHMQFIPNLIKRGALKQGITINKDLVAGEAVYFKEVTKPS